MIPNHIDEIDSGGPFAWDSHGKTFMMFKPTLNTSAYAKLSSTQALVSTHASNVVRWLTHFRRVLTGARLQVRRYIWLVPYTI